MVGQSIFRVQKDNDNPYIMLNKGFLNNPNLSWKAKGLLAYLLNLPNDWKIHEKEVIAHSKDGRYSYRKALKELINLGYVHRDRIKNKKVNGRHQSIVLTRFQSRTGFPATDYWAIY